MSHEVNIWRDTALPVRFGLFDIVSIDAQAVFPLVIWLIDLSWRTFFLAVAAIAAFALMERFGLRPAAAMRRLRMIMAGFEMPGRTRLPRQNLDYRGQ